MTTRLLTKSPDRGVDAGASAEPAAVEVRDVWVRLGRRDVLRNVSLAVGQGERVAIIGPNGAGKTTLLRTVATLLRPSRGALQVAGHDMRGAAAAVRAASGYVGHQPHLYEQLTARENLSFLASLYHVHNRVARIDEVLDTVGLSADADRRVGEYSRGMQQRLALGAATLHRPAVLLLDEPDAGLDSAAVAMLPQTLDRLCPGAAVLFSTHDTSVAEALADRTVSISGGILTAEPPRPDLPPRTLPQREGVSGIAGGEFFAAVWNLLRKDVKVEWRAREQLPTLVVFTLLLALVFDMAFVFPGADQAPHVAAAVLWSSLLLAVTLGGIRLFASEHDRGTLTRLRLAPIDPSAIFFGKWLLLVLQALLVGVVQLAALSVLLNLQLFQGGVVATLALAAAALAAVAALQSALVVDSRARELLMPLLAMPLSIPVMLASVGATLATVQGDPAAAQLPWLGLLGFMAAVFSSLAVVLYPFAAES